jgi:hypothetical protein
MEEIVLKIKAEGGGDAEQKVKSIKQQLREAKEAATQAKEGTEEYFAALSKAAGLADILKDVNESVAALNPGDKAAAFGNLINTVAGGFQTITGLYGLLGSKSEDVEKLLLKVQAASALAMGVQSLVEAQKQWTLVSKVIQATTVFQKANTLATAAAAAVQKLFTGAVNTTSTSFKGLKAAIVSTGIGALVVAIGLAVNALMDFMESTDDAASAQEDLNKQLANTQSALEALNLLYDATAIGIKARLDLAKAQGKSLEELAKLELELFDNSAARLKTNQLADQANNKLTEDAIKKLQAKSKLNKDEKTQLDELIVKQIVLGAQMKKNDADVAAIDTNRKVLLLNQDKAIKDRNDKDAKDAKDRIDRRAKDLQDLKNKFAAEQKATIDNNLKLLQELDKFENERGLKAAKLRQNELDENKDFRQKKVDLLRLTLQEEEDIRKVAKDRELAEEEAIKNAKLSLARSTVQGLSALGDILLKDGKKATALQKALALAGLAIDTAQAIGGLTAASAKNPLNAPTSGLAGAAQFASGIVQILANIAQAKKLLFSGDVNKFAGGGGGGSITVPTAPAATPPNIQAPNNTSGFLQQDSESFKVFVVESDITNAQGIVQQNKKKAILTI